MGDGTEPMTPAQFAAAMRDVDKEIDQEERHWAADQLLLKTLKSLGYGEGCETFQRMERWYA